MNKHRPRSVHYSPHSADFTKTPRPAVFHERGQPLSVAEVPDQLHCPLIWAILKPHDAVAVVNQTTVDTNVQFTVDAIMYMYVNNLTIHNVRKCEVERIICNPV